MRFAIYGAGAIGGYLGGMLSLAGEDVTLIARGPHFDAMVKNGLVIETSSGTVHTTPNITDDPSSIGPVDYIFLTVKAHSIPEIVLNLDQLIKDTTAIVSAQNGIPWWYFEKYEGPLSGKHIECVDPDRIISKNISPDRIIGCIVYPATEMSQPGVIRHIEGDRFSLGELDGSHTDRCKTLADILIRSGFRAPIRTDIRKEIWTKLLGNMAFNPLSALTRSTLAEMTKNDAVASISKSMMAEADAVAVALGLDIPISIEQRFQGAQKVGNHKTSMLQDLEAGRRLELNSIIGAALEIGDLLDIPMPYTKTIYSCLSLLVRE